MIQTKEQKETSKQLSQLAYIQNYIEELESIFFIKKDFDTNLSYIKLDTNSYGYDNNYDKDVRRKDLNLLYLLDEIFLSNKIKKSSALKPLNELEDFIFSAEFYRQLIFGNLFFPIEKKLEQANTLLRNNINILRKKISDDNYVNNIADLGFLNPPATHEAFIVALIDLIKFLEQKRNYIKSRPLP